MEDLVRGAVSGLERACFRSQFSNGCGSTELRGQEQQKPRWKRVLSTMEGQIGEAIGIWWTIALLIADAVLGSLLARSQGRATWRRFNAALQAGRPPASRIPA